MLLAPETKYSNPSVPLIPLGLEYFVSGASSILVSLRGCRGQGRDDAAFTSLRLRALPVQEARRVRRRLGRQRVVRAGQFGQGPADQRGGWARAGEDRAAGQLARSNDDAVVVHGERDVRAAAAAAGHAHRGTAGAAQVAQGPGEPARLLEGQPPLERPGRAEGEEDRDDG